MYTYTSQQGKRETITTVDEAKRVIVATATVREHNREELMKDTDILSVASHFAIDLTGLSISRSSSPYDFCYTYSFKQTL